ncbi:MFS transporter [Asanoa iriomotensis]|uniref:MFS transporter n=2 Tax=Asanoa iriomotensis TaxID=234613 RepID=A0ABQ4C1B5_9ACTN|nr:MFS transporter [Asanoa iriomotensis]
MIAADLFRAIALATIPVAYMLDALSLPLLIAVSLMIGAATVVFDIGAFAYLPSLVPERDLGAANRAMQGSATVTSIGGPGLGGFLVNALGAPIALIVDAVSFVASAVGVAAARRAEPRQGVDARPRGFTTGIRILLGNPALRNVTASIGIFNAANQAFLVNLVIWAVTENGVTASLYGLIFTVGGVGAFIGTVIVVHIARRLGHGRAMAALMVVAGPVPLLMAILPFHGTELALYLMAFEFVISVALGGFNVLSPTLRQSAVAYGDLARVEGVYRFVIYGSMPLGSAVGGILGTALGSHVGLILAGCGNVLVMPLIARPSILRIRDPREARGATWRR